MKMKKSLAMILVIALTLSLTMALMLPASAEDGDTPGGDTSAASVPTSNADDATLVKYLQKGTDVDNPGATFNFSITSETDGAAAPTKTSISDESMSEDANGDLIGKLTVAEIFAGANWTKAGEFVYTVNEIAATYSSKDNEELTIDNDTEYTLRVYVKNDGNGGFVIDKVTVEKDGEKIDAGDDEIPATADEGDGKGFSFTNTFQKNLVSEDPSDPEKGIVTLEKEVSGDYADTTYEFPFEFSFSKPAANPDGVVKYVVFKKDGSIKSAETTATSSPISVALAHGEKMSITAMPQGTTWSTEELLSSATCQNAGKYTAAADKYSAGETAQGANHSTVAQVISTTDSVKYTNTIENDDVTPTGIIMNNLPYILLVLIAGAMIILFIIKRRKENEA